MYFFSNFTVPFHFTERISYLPFVSLTLTFVGNINFLTAYFEPPACFIKIGSMYLTETFEAASAATGATTDAVTASAAAAAYNLFDFFV